MPLNTQETVLSKLRSKASKNSDLSTYTARKYENNYRTGGFEFRFLIVFMNNLKIKHTKIKHMKR